MGEYGQEMEYGTWVRFCLCEEALTSGEFTERDLEYCFRLADEDGTGKIGLHVIAPFYEDMVRSLFHKCKNANLAVSIII